MTPIIMTKAHGNCCSDNALYKNGLLLLVIIIKGPHVYIWWLILQLSTSSLCFFSRLFVHHDRVLFYTAKLLFHQSPTRHSDYTVTITVTMQSLFSSPRHCDYWTVTTSDTHVIRYPLPWGLCRNLSTRHLVGNCMSPHGKTLDTRYIQSLCRNQGGTDTRFCSLPLGF